MVNVVTGENSIGAALSAHPGIAKMTFTGSTETGRKIMASAAATLKRLTLELGGNDAGIVLPDADPARIAEGLFWGAFINSGQTCAALKRLYVHDHIYDDVCRHLTEYAANIIIGDGLDEKSVLGPVQNAMQFNKVRELVDDARAKGARILIGGEAAEGPGYFYPITLVADIDNGTRLVDEEQFGPVLPIIRYSDIDEVIRRANDNPSGLGGSGLDPAMWKRRVQSPSSSNAARYGSTSMARSSPMHPLAVSSNRASGSEFGTDGLKEFTTIQTVLS